jgi:uncharacterized protein YvpB
MLRTSYSTGTVEKSEAVKLKLGTRPRRRYMDGIQHNQGSTTFTGQGMEMLRLTMMLRCLGMEMKGLKMVRHSVYAQAKRELGFKGNKQAVYDQLAAHIRAKLQESKASEADLDALIAGTR